MSNDITNLALIVGVIMGLIEVLKLLVNKITGNGTGGIRKQVDAIIENHLHQLPEIKSGVDKINQRTEESNGKLIEIIGLLKLLVQKK